MNGRPVLMFLFMRRPDDTVIGYPMTGTPRDGAIEFTTYRKAAKARYLAADERVCVVIVNDDDPAEGVALWGRSRLIDPAAFIPARPEVGPTDVPDAVIDTVRERLEDGKRVVFRIEVDHSRPSRRVVAANAEA
ncbi:hypothetical protein A5692_15790 [Mycobacterium sp. E342]|nr:MULTISPECIES: pyridoxamine 5'-phosphate oxidase family protein [Mycobacterium]OBH14996.1 hypothetical protein A9X04_13475 [Mycobacterium sp. E3247]OBH32155.1 hypothetical protein A5692_15790 [Mycobacterium sp. E342]